MEDAAADPDSAEVPAEGDEEEACTEEVMPDMESTEDAGNS